MDWDEISGRWHEFRGKVKQQWGRLTDDDLDRINGKREQLMGSLQRLYGRSREAVEREIREFETRFFGDRPAGQERTAVGAPDVGDERLADTDVDLADEPDYEDRTRPQADGGQRAAPGGDFTGNEWSDEESRG